LVILELGVSKNYFSLLVSTLILLISVSQVAGITDTNHLFTESFVHLSTPHSLIHHSCVWSPFILLFFQTTWSSGVPGPECHSWCHGPVLWEHRRSICSGL
jgi:cellobiose-specific phosphotransferase system component IIC